MLICQTYTIYEATFYILKSTFMAYGYGSSLITTCNNDQKIQLN